MKNQGFRSSEHGGAIVWILIMITLLAALTFAATRGSRTGLSNLDKEQSDLAANEILSYAQGVRDAARALKIRGCAETRISYQNATTGVTYNNTNAPGDSSCHVFHGAGGGITYNRPQQEWLDINNANSTHYGQWFITPSSYVAGLGVYGTGGGACVGGATDCWEVIIGLPFINKNICMAINRKLNFGTTTDGTPPVDTGASFAQTGSVPFTGTFPVGGSEMGNATPAFYSGTHAGCIEGGANPPTGTYHFFQVITVR